MRQAAHRRLAVCSTTFALFESAAAYSRIRAEVSSTQIGGKAMMQATYTETIEHERALFSPLPQTPFAVRLGRAFKDAVREFARNPLAYLRLVFLPERIGDWLPMRLVRAAAFFLAHPLSGLGGLFYRERIPVGFIYPT